MPQPLGFYGLQLSESLERFITTLDYKALSNLNGDLAFHLRVDDDEPERFYAISFEFIKWLEDEIEDLSIPQKIALMRFCSDRLASLYTEPMEQAK